MKIELYMASIDQDFSSRTLGRLVAYLESGKGSRSTSIGADNNYNMNWGNWDNWNNWNNWNNWKNWANFAGVKELDCQEVSQCIGSIRLRSESFGGLAYNPISRRVFKMDSEAYRALKVLVGGTSVGHAASQIGVQKAEIDRIVSYVLEE